MPIDWRNTLIQTYALFGGMLGKTRRVLFATGSIGDKCYVQNQYGNHPKRWNKSGTVVESCRYSAYNVKLDGSGRVTK